MKTDGVVRIAILLGTALGARPAVLQALPVQPPRPSQPKALDVVLGSLHGLSPVSPEVEAALAALRRDPVGTAVAVDRRYPVAAFHLLVHRDLDFERAVLLLDALDHPAADRLLGRWCVELRRVRAAATSVDRPDYDQLVLQRLGGVYDPSVVKASLEGLESQRSTARRSALVYLASVAADHAEIQPALEARYRDQSSTLYLDAAVGRLLGFLRDKARHP